MAHRDHSRRLLGFARTMRREPTDAERKLWFLLRRKRLEGFKFRRQVPVAGYILDFYCAKMKLSVELDGRQHGEVEQEQYDEKRTQHLQSCGIRTLQFTNHDVLKREDRVVNTIYGELKGDSASREPPP